MFLFFSSPSNDWADYTIPCLLSLNFSAPPLDFSSGKFFIKVVSLRLLCKMHKIECLFF